MMGLWRPAAASEPVTRTSIESAGTAHVFPKFTRPIADRSIGVSARLALDHEALENFQLGKICL